MKKLTISSVIYIGGTVLNAFLGLLFYILTARVLGPSKFGILSVVLAISVISSDIFDFGLNTGLVKFVSSLKNSKRVSYLQTFLGIKIVISLFQVLLGLIVSYFVSIWLFKDSNLALIVFLGFVASAATTLFGFYNSAYLSDKSFISSITLLTLSNIVRLILFYLISVYTVITMDWIMIAYISCLIVSPLVLIVFDRRIRILPRIAGDLLKDVLHFSKWVGGSLIVGTISARLDNLFLVRLTNPLETGIYTSVQRIFLAFNQLIGASSSVLAPDMSSLDRTRIKHSFVLSFALAGLFIFGLLVVLLLAPIGIPILLGKSYSPSILVFQILTIGSIFFVLSFPFNNSLLYRKGKSKQLFGIDIVRSLFIVVLDILLIPVLGAVGAALANVFTLIVSFVLIALLYFVNRNKDEK